jgi:hypothetical protein
MAIVSAPQSQHYPPLSGSASGGLEVRVDPAHPRTGPDAASDRTVEAAPADEPGLDEFPLPPADAVLQAQAAELGQLLLARQRDLDRREAQLHARLAEFDNQTRAARLWFEERRFELTERTAEVAPTGQRTVAESQRLSEREIELRKLTRQLAAAVAECEELRQAALERQRDWQQHELAVRGEATEVAARGEEALAARRHELALRGAELDARSAALDQARVELGAVDDQLHDALSAAEAIWKQLATHARPAIIEATLDRLRRERAARRRQAEEQEQAGLRARQALLVEMAQARETLRREREDLDRRMQAARADLAERAAELEFRERELRVRASADALAQEAWRIERLRMQAELGAAHASAL